ncbi:MAG: YbaB/EbfC family nucleoid-associated protein [Aerococcus sp.]|nr:YbaB/EbfC family nucleoid-associated protein [Aerococcus sp.]
MANNMMNMQKMMKEAQKLQKQMTDAQSELAKKAFIAKDPSGMVKVTVNGEKKVQALSIAPEAIDPDDPEMLEDLIIAAMNGALDKVDQAAENQLGQFTKNIPGL